MAYQLVPYLMSVGVRGNSQELRPIWDIDAKRTSLHDTLVKVSHASRKRHFIDPSDRARKLEMSSLKVGERTILTEWHPGRSGIESSIRRQDGSIVPRTALDTEFVPVRHAIFSPAASSYAILFAERVGVTGAVSMSSKLVKDTFAKYNPGLRLEIAPAVTLDVIQRMIENHPIKSLVFTRPRPSDPTGRFIKVSGESVELEVRMRPARRRSWRLRDLPKEQQSQQVTAASLLGVLAPNLKPGEDPQRAVEALLDDGWQASLQVKFKGGAQRLVSMEQRHSSTMSFPVIPPEEDGGERPTNEQFRQACVEVLRLFVGQYGIDERSPENCRWDEAEWQDDACDWEVQWDEPGTAPPAST